MFTVQTKRARRKMALSSGVPCRRGGHLLAVNYATYEVIALPFALLMLLPLIPGLRDIPRWIPIYRVIWRRYYVNAPRSSNDPARNDQAGHRP
jgi:hypothetical protein